MELRSALAEGDLTADVLTDAGAWVPLDRSHWLGKDGLTTVRRSRLRVQVPGTQTPPVDGTVVIQEGHLMNWIGSISLTDGERTKTASPAVATEDGATPPAAELELHYPAIGDVPGHLHLTACEVLTWIGYGRAISKAVYYAPVANSPVATIDEKMALLHRSVPDPKPSEDPMEDAERKLMELLRAKRVHMLIERGGVFEEVSDSIYEYAVAVNARGSVEPDANATERDQARARSYLLRLQPFGDVLFRKTEVLEAWQNTVSDGEQPHPPPVVFSETTSTSLNESLQANPTSKGEPISEQVGEQEAATPTPKPDPVPSPSTDLEFIDLKSELPRLPRYTIKGPLPKATEEQVDECIKKIAELDGGKTNRRMIRDWGRHWLRTARHVDTNKMFLETWFSDPEHEERRRPGGNPRNAG